MTDRVFIFGATHRDCEEARRQYAPSVDRRAVVMVNKSAPTRTAGLRIRQSDKAYDLTGELSLDVMAMHVAVGQGLPPEAWRLLLEAP